MAITHTAATSGALAKAAGRLGALARSHRPRGANTTVYQVTDRLHAGRTARVPVDGISATVSAWLAEYGAQSRLAEDLSRAVGAGDWPTTHAISDCLSVDVAVAA